MPYVERTDEEIAAAFAEVIEKMPHMYEKAMGCPCPDGPGHTHETTYADLLREIKEGTGCGKDFIGAARRICKKLDVDPMEWILKPPRKSEGNWMTIR